MAEGRRRRLLVRAALALAVALAVGWLWSWPAGVIAAGLVAAADAVYRWRTHEAVRTWRKGAIGERRTARMLRSLPAAVAATPCCTIGRCRAPERMSTTWSSAGPGSSSWTRRTGAGTSGSPGGAARCGSARCRETRPWVRSCARPVRWPKSSVARPGGRSTSCRCSRSTAPPCRCCGSFRVVQVDGVPLLRASQVRHWITRRGTRLPAQEVAQLSAAAERLLSPYERHGPPTG